MPVIIAPVKVQGETSARQVAGAIKYLNTNDLCDVIIVSRGGGSFEDLWSFSDEIVVRAIYESKLPVISAVGHNIDHPLCDFVADLRAPTPSAAAELVVASKVDFESNINNHQHRMNMLLVSVVNLYKTKLESIKNNYVFHEPQSLIARYMQQLDSFDISMDNSLKRLLSKSEIDFGAYKSRLSSCADKMVLEQRSDLVAYENRMNNLLGACLRQKESVLAVVEGKLNAFNPYGVLQRGYSITTKKDGSVVRSLKDVSKGEQLVTRVKDGVFDVDVL
jgi:exodeoxyribonuclease VII large subunit